jgi:putative selenium metabolism hydrolase
MWLGAFTGVAYPPLCGGRHYAVVDVDALVSFTQRLVATESPSGQEGAVAVLVREEMERLGYAVEVDALGNVVGTLGDGDGPCVLLDAHMDTVGVTDRAAWSADPAGELRDGRLYGRGSVDMKGPLAAVVHGVAATAIHGRVVVSASIAEEMIEGYATVEVARRVRPDVAVICEPSHRTVVVGQRGRAELIVEVEGRPSHSSMPDLGVNAVEAMADVLVAARGLELPEHPALGPAILVVTDVISRPFPALSVLPDRCTATFDRRTLPGEGEDDVLGQLREAAEAAVARHGARVAVTIGLDRFDAYTGTPVEAPNFAPAWYTGADAPVARAALRAVGGEPGHWLFCTNGSGTAALGIPTVGFGPGDETLAHRVDEHIELAELEAGARDYAALVEALTA